MTFSQQNGHGAGLRAPAVYSLAEAFSGHAGVLVWPVVLEEPFMSFETLSWLFVAAVAVHNLEEAVWLPAWSKTAGRWHVAVGAGQFRFAVAVLTALAVAAAGLAGQQGKASAGAYLLCGYALAMVLNAAFPHVLASLAMRRYMPGTTTALLFNLPAGAALIGVALDESYIALPRFLLAGPAVVLAIVASIPFLFWLGKKAGCA
jgi:Protein of unknown function with HXXEE motif